MRFRLSIFVGLVLCVVLLAAYGLFHRTIDSRDGWRPNAVYSNVGGSSYSTTTFSGVSSSANGLGAPAVSMRGSNSMLRRRAVSSYAPAYVAPSSFANSQYPIGGTASSGVAPVYTTSSATAKSFGSGNAVSGVYMSGGSVRATHSQSSIGSSQSSIANIQLPIANIQSPTANTQLPISNIQSPIASNYQGIGNTTIGGPRAMRGRQNLGIDDDNNVEDTWLNWLAMMGKQYGHEENGVWVYDIYDLRSAYDAYCASWNFGMGKKPTWDEWLDWFMGSEGDPYWWDDGDNNKYGFSYVPVGDFMPLIVFAFLYLVFMVYRRRQCKMINSSEDVE